MVLEVVYRVVPGRGSVHRAGYPVLPTPPGYTLHSLHQGPTGVQLLVCTVGERDVLGSEVREEIGPEDPERLPCSELSRFLEESSPDVTARPGQERVLIG